MIVSHKITPREVYETLFLYRNELRERQGLYISREN
jgi:hypothetical protein